MKAPKLSPPIDGKLRRCHGCNGPGRRFQRLGKGTLLCPKCVKRVTRTAIVLSQQEFPDPAVDHLMRSNRGLVPGSVA